MTRLGEKLDRSIFSADLFSLYEPSRHTIPFVYNSPHSGRYYPESFLEASRLDFHDIRRSEDYYIDLLFEGALDIGAPLLAANFPRSYLDVNREPYELDPKMFDGPLPPYVNIGSMRVAGGLGTVPRIVAENMEIYQRRMPVVEALERIEHVYKPYHNSLSHLLGRTHAAFGMAILVDCHSMPGSIRLPGSNLKPDIIIGDRYGTSASRDISQAALHFLQELGFVVACNKPYAGGFITEYYGRPTRSVHALQIELNRSLYIDEKTLELLPQFHAVKTSLEIFMQQFADFVCDSMVQSPFAAE
jgi:N-formylglutamate amidohydrolase